MFSLAADQYTNPDIFQQEKQSIFSSCWIPIAHRSEFPGSSSAIERSLLNRSMVLVRENDTIRAFYNLCRHRAGVLLWQEECKSLKALRCKYHGWRYQTDGKLTHTPDFGATVDKENMSLYSIPLKEWCGFIFICLGKNKSQQNREAAAGL